MNYSTVIILFTAAAFLYYGIACLFSPTMIKEFERFGLSERRRLTGVLQLMGGFGLITGIFISPIIGGISAGGLSLLMLLGFAVRIKIRDSLGATIPSFFFMIVTAYIVYAFYQMV